MPQPIARDSPVDVTESSPEPEHATPPVAESATPAKPLRNTRKLAMIAGLGAVVAVNVALISSPPRPSAEAPSAAPSATTAESAEPAPANAELEPLPPLVGAKRVVEPDEEKIADEPSAPKPKTSKHFRTVNEAAARTCSTSAVDGLSRQIIAQARCIDPGAFVALPRQPNISAAAHVFLNFDRAARDELVAVLKAHPKWTMKINSALRTVAQQYMLSRWAKQKRCNIELATPPGESNHETGLALDISDPMRWRSTLEAHGFRWLGKIDRVHFDYKGVTASSHTNVDVTAFQQLWNRNHPDDRVAETGTYDAETERRLKEAPAAGFERGASCGSDRPASSGGGSSRTRAR